MQTIGERIPAAYEELARYLASRGIEPTGPSVIRYREVDPDGDFVIEVGWEIEEGQRIDAPYFADIMPEGTYAVLTHRGPYTGIGATTRVLMEWGDDAGVRFAWDDASEAWDCWFEHYLTEPTFGPEGPEGSMDICLLTDAD